VRELGEVATAMFEDFLLARSPGQLVGALLDITAAAERLRDPIALAPAYTGLGFIFLATPLSRLADGYLGRARALLGAAPRDRPDLRAHLEMVEACAHINRGRWPEALAALGAELAHRRGMRDPRSESVALSQRCYAELFRGDLVRVHATLARLEELERSLDRAWWGVPLLHGVLALRRGDLDEAARRVAAMDACFPADAPGGHAIADGPAALCALRRGELGEARRRADAALACLRAIPPMTYAFLDAVPAVAEVYAALWAEAKDRAGAAVLEARMARLLAILRRFSVVVPIAGSSAFLWHGRWAALRGQAARARWCFGRALAAAERHQLPFDEALAHQALAGAGVGEERTARGASERAAAHRLRACAGFERLGASWHAAQVSRAAPT
jgi:hypothetical protein